MHELKGVLDVSVDPARLAQALDRLLGENKAVRASIGLGRDVNAQLGETSHVLMLLLLGRFCRAQAGQHAVLAAVGEVDHEPDREPDEEPRPVLRR